MTTKQGVESNRGLLLKDVGGRYTVRTGGGELVECRARGLFRLEKISPLAGDNNADTPGFSAVELGPSVVRLKDALDRKTVE